MAITSAELQAQLGTNAMNALVVRDASIATVQLWFIEGMVPYTGRARWVATDPNEGALTQAGSVSAAMVA